MKRRHLSEADRPRLPQIVDLEGWTVAPWELAPASPQEGHPVDAIVTLTKQGGAHDGLRTRVVLTSYDLDGRTDEQLAVWLAWKVRDELATVLRLAA